MTRKTKAEPPPAGIKYHIRWMIRRDLPYVLDIERASFEFPWRGEEFIHTLKQRNSIGMIAEAPTGDYPIAFMVYELHRERLHVLNFAVSPQYRVMGVGRAMVDKLKSKLSAAGRMCLSTIVRDSNVAGHLFLKSQGFHALDVFRGFYDECDDDAYYFEYEHGGERGER